MSIREGRRGLAAVERNVAIQRRLVADLVDVSMLNVGKMKLERERANVPRWCARAGHHAGAGRRAPGHAGDDLAPATEHRRGWTPRASADLWNLVSNAIKFSPEAARCIGCRPTPTTCMCA
jgi:signal transduction histidine kinase